MVGYRDAVDIRCHKLEKPFLWCDLVRRALGLLPGMSIEGRWSMRVEVKLPPTRAWEGPDVVIPLDRHAEIFTQVRLSRIVTSWRRILPRQIRHSLPVFMEHFQYPPWRLGCAQFVSWKVDAQRDPFCTCLPQGLNF